MLGSADLPTPLRGYLTLVALGGPTAALAAAATSPDAFGDLGVAAVMLVVLAAIANRFPLQVRHQTHIQVHGVALTALILAAPGPTVGALVLVACALRFALQRRDLDEVLFNTGQTALYTTVGALTLAATRDADSLGPWVGHLGPVGAIVLVGVVTHAANFTLVSVAAGLQVGVSPIRVWRQNLLSEVGTEAMLFAVGVVAALLADEHPWALPIVFLPTVVLHRAMRQGARLRADTRDALAQMVALLEVRDPYTAGHSHRVAATARAVAVRLGLTAEEADLVESAGRVHDIGKAVLDPSILTKSEPLEDDEMAQMRLHPVHGAGVVSHFASYGDGHRLVRHHHERWDGAGYPDGLRGDVIPLGARILAVADAYDAMTSARPYRPAMTPAAAARVLAGGAGTQWDPRVVTAMLEHLAENTDRGIPPAPADRSPKPDRALAGARVGPTVPGALAKPARTRP